MAPLMHLDEDEIVEALLLGPTDNEPITSPTPEEEAVLLGDELEPLEAQEATSFPCEHPEAPEPEESAEWSDALCLPAPSATALGSSVNQSWDTRRAWHRARPRHLATLDPLAIPSEWVPAYRTKRDELPTWWPEFWSLCYWETGPLSQAQLQGTGSEACHSLQATWEKSSWWNAPPSLVSLGCQDSLPPSPSTPQGPRDI